jgi:uncharacterized protein (TIGR03435 family)
MVVRVAAATLLLAAGFARAGAQVPAPVDPEARFDVASIRPGNVEALAASGGIGLRMLPNGISAGFSTVRMLIMSAYQLRDHQVIGGPTWMNVDRFDISARADREITPSVGRQMLINLLADRFKLRVRTETRRADVYALALANADGRLGPQLKRTSAECEATLEARKNDTAPPAAPNFELIRKQTVCGMTMVSSSANGARVTSVGAMPLERLVSQISTEIGGPVIDRTGLTGLFDMILEYASTRPQFQTSPTVVAPDLSKDAAPPTLRDALREQLGLRLVTEEGPLEVLVIDSVERPSVN